ncbi:bacteriocin biosynthesis cyclodehydratase domain-containing protein [Staphylococcus hominis]
MENKYLYFLAPNVTLGKLKDSLIGLKGDTIIKIDGTHIIDFITYLNKMIDSNKGMEFQDLKNSLNVDSEELEKVLNFLVDNKILSKYINDSNDSIKITSDKIGDQVDTLTMKNRLSAAEVNVISNNKNEIANKLVEHLKEKGIKTTKQENYNEKDSFRIVVAESHLDPIMKEINSQSLIDQKPWLSIIPYDGKKAWVGPFYIPYQSACNYCYNLRKSANFDDEVLRHRLMELEPLDSHVKKGEVYDSSINLIQIGIAGNLITEYVLLKEYAPNAIPGGIQSITLDSSGISIDSHRVFKVPRCPKCSQSSDTGYPQVWFHEEGDINE